MSRLACIVGIACIASIVSTAIAAPKSRTKKHRRAAKSLIDATTTSAYRYANLGADECYAELDQRGLPYEKEPEAPGVLAPVRLTGPLHGVVFRTNESAAKRETSHWEIADCRLVLALDDFAAILSAHDVTEVRHYSMYRPPSTSWPDGKLGTRHTGALALDAGRFLRKDGSHLDVDDHFSGRIGARTCGTGAKPRRKTPESIELRAILCETVAARLFTVVLTPNHNRAHKNHFHLDLMAGVAWFIVD